MSTLSKGPVAPSDKIGRSDPALILKSCMSDGKLLQGDHPAWQVDKVHVAKAFGSMKSDDQVGRPASHLCIHIHVLSHLKHVQPFHSSTQLTHTLGCHFYSHNILCVQ